MLSRFMTRREQLVLLFVACSIVVGSAVLFVTRTSGPVTPVSEIVESVTPPESAIISKDIETLPVVAENPVVVSVQGAVLEPGVYHFPLDARVSDAIESANGVEPLADTTSINLAAKLTDGTTLYIPTKRDKETVASSLVKNDNTYILGRVGSPTSPIVGSSANPRINVNTATQSELEALPGIGPVYAKAIVDYRSKRPFRKAEELLNVRGIGEKRLEGMRDLISVE